MINFSKKSIMFVIYFIIITLIIFKYGSYLCNNPGYKDILRTYLGIYDLDGWSLTHLFFFMFIGYHYKNKYLIIAFILGILWEIFEQYGSRDRELALWLGATCEMNLGARVGCPDCKNLETDREDSNWWYGKWTDILMNGLGLIIGYYLKNETLPFKLLH